MSARILLIRHAETAQPEILHGSESDVDLSPRGERQAEALARVLVPERPDGIVSSNMLRARKTAAAISRATALPVRIEPALRERAVGVLSGQPKSVGKIHLWPETVQAWLAGDTSYTTEGAESIDAVRARVLPAWQALAEEFAGRKLVVVAHGMMSRMLLLTILDGYSLADWDRLGSIRNCSITDLEFRDGLWIAHRLNETPAEVAAA